MPSLERIVRVYSGLADWYDQHGQTQLRDRFLVLAADTALTGGDDAEAEHLRQRLLRGSPHHMLRPFASFAQAATSPDVQSYLEDLRNSYPLETAEDFLESLRGDARTGQTDLRPLPQTAPVIDLSAEADDGPDTLKVFSGQDDADDYIPIMPTWDDPPATSAWQEKKPTAMPRPKRRPSQTAPPPPPPRPVAPVARVMPALLPAQPGPAADHHEAERPAGGWVATVLFYLVLVAGVLLVVGTLVRPFLLGG